MMKTDKLITKWNPYILNIKPNHNRKHSMGTNEVKRVKLLLPSHAMHFPTAEAVICRRITFICLLNNKIALARSIFV
jgi:hypothetical protein